MKPFQMLSLGLGLLLLLVAYMDYREKKNMNNYIRGAAPKKPCSCTDHLDTSPNTDHSDVVVADDALSVAGL